MKPVCSCAFLPDALEIGTFWAGAFENFRAFDFNDHQCFVLF